MMRSEFIERTGFEPTYEEYEAIEELYYNFDGDKDEFCAKWLADGGIMNTCRARAKKIDQLNSKILELDRSNRQDDEKQVQRITNLEKELDRELEWKPADGVGTCMSEDRYQELLKAAGKTMTEQEAKELIADECGFAIDKIKILTKVSTYEKDKYHRCRVSATYERQPVYESTDWNYIRFNCGNFMYEFENGVLRFYCC